MKGKYGMNLLNPLVAAQNFEYKMSNSKSSSDRRVVLTLTAHSPGQAARVRLWVHLGAAYVLPLAKDLLTDGLQRVLSPRTATLRSRTTCLGEDRSRRTSRARRWLATTQTSLFVLPLCCHA